jgi:hypothetical protein
VKVISVIVLLAAVVGLQAEPPSETAVKKALNVPAPEMAAVAVRMVREARPADKKATKDLVIKTIKSKRPGAVLLVQQTLDAAEPAANRPPTTPGNEHGNRPTVPPGLNNYGTP